MSTGPIPLPPHTFPGFCPCRLLGSAATQTSVRRKHTDSHCFPLPRSQELSEWKGASTSLLAHPRVSFCLLPGVKRTAPAVYTVGLAHRWPKKKQPDLGQPDRPGSLASLSTELLCSCGSSAALDLVQLTHQASGKGIGRTSRQKTPAALEGLTGHLQKQDPMESSPEQPNRQTGSFCP